jgi:hypothetical protein
MFRHIGLHHHASGIDPASGAAGHLVEQLIGPLGGPQVAPREAESASTTPTRSEQRKW